MKPGKKIYLLLGQKGSGKSYIASIMESQFGIKFIQTEDIAKNLIDNRKYDDESYLKEVFEAIEKEIRNAINTNSEIVVESTGLSSYFDQMLSSISNDYKVIKIKIEADSDLCLVRIKNRVSNDIILEENEIREINEAFDKKIFRTDFSILNNDNTVEDLNLKIGSILKVC